MVLIIILSGVAVSAVCIACAVLMVGDAATPKR